MLLSISNIVGERLRNYRRQKGWSQEVLAERAELHPTYIGQLERGEKNATLETVSKVAQALDISLGQLFENISLVETKPDVATQCYGMIQRQSPQEQEMLFRILCSIIEYKDE